MSNFIKFSALGIKIWQGVETPKIKFFKIHQILSKLKAKFFPLDNLKKNIIFL